MDDGLSATDLLVAGVIVECRGPEHLADLAARLKTAAGSRSQHGEGEE